MATNIVALAKAVNHIEHHPGGWNQGSWCGCLAAQVVRAEGFSINDEYDVLDANGDFVGRVWDVATGLIFGEPYYLDNNEARKLFHSGNSLDRVKELVSQFVAREVEAELLAASEVSNFIDSKVNG